MRFFAASLDNLFPTTLDTLLASTHPTLQQRFDAIEAIHEADPSLKDKNIDLI